MAVWLKRAATGVGLIVLASVLAIWFGSRLWDEKTAGIAARLDGTHAAGGDKTVTFKDLERLPRPVVRYFQHVLKEGQPLIRSGRIVQSGEFLTDPSNGWNPFVAVQHISAAPPGFVWDARIRMAPFMPVRVRDAYVRGKGSMTAKMFSIIPVMDAPGKTELNAGALQRYLAEAVWYPTALLPGQGVKWTVLGGNSALATLTDSGTAVSMQFQFNEAGEVTGISTPGRYREVKGKYELTPWAGRFRNYQERNGMLIPTEGEVEWRLPTGAMPYWKGRIVSIEYEFAS